MQKLQLLRHGQHQFSIYLIVPIDFLHKPALGREFGQYVGFHAAQHDALAAQMFAEQLRLGDHRTVVAVAPFARKAFPIAQKMEIQNVDYVPDFAAVVINRRSGKADAVFAGFR